MDTALGGCNVPKVPSLEAERYITEGTWTWHQPPPGTEGGLRDGTERVYI